MKCSCPTKDATRYRHWITIQTPSGTADASGHIDLSDDSNWTASGRVKVNFITKGSREGRIFDQIQGEVSHVVETRSTTFSRSITPDMRAVFNSRTFNITAVFDVNESRQTVQLHLTEVV